MVKVACVRDLKVDPLLGQEDRVRGSISDKNLRGRIPFQMSIDQAIELRIEPGDQITFEKTGSGYAVNIRKTGLRCWGHGTPVRK